jgi:hypothetical protein
MPIMECKDVVKCVYTVDWIFWNYELTVFDMIARFKETISRKRMTERGRPTALTQKFSRYWRLCTVGDRRKPWEILAEELSTFHK